MEETAGSRDGAGLVAPPGEEGGAARVVMSTVLVVTAPSVTLALVGSSGLEGAGECFRATARGATVLAREQQRAGAGGAGADGRHWREVCAAARAAASCLGAAPTPRVRCKS